jgi:hypothetical protein
MAWLTWRQHRQQLVWGAALIVAVTLAELISELPIRAAYHRQALASCLPPSAQSGCDIIIRHFESEFATGVNAARGLVILPALVGVFVGAPLLAREFEHGTYRLAWTQTVTRRQWLLAKTTLIAIATVAGAGLAAAVTMWWRGPFDTLEGRMAPSGFDIEGPVVPAYALFALALGVLAGLLLRRTVAAMTVTLVAFVAVRLAVARFLRPRFLTAQHASTLSFSGGARPRDWVLSDQLVDAVGRQITAAREDLAILHAQQGGIDPHDYLATLGWRRIIMFQPADRFWAFQTIEAGIFAALALLVVAVTVWAVRRAPA